MSGFAQGLIAGIVALLLTIQFIRPAKTNPPIVRQRTLEAAVAVPPEVRRFWRDRVTIAIRTGRSGLGTATSRRFLFS